MLSLQCNVDCNVFLSFKLFTYNETFTSRHCATHESYGDNYNYTMEIAQIIQEQFSVYEKSHACRDELSDEKIRFLEAVTFYSTKIFF